MKNRRLFLGVFLLIAALLIGVGYAALTNELTIGGELSASKNDDNLKVEFVNYEAHTFDVNNAEDTTFTVKPSVSGKTATIDVNNLSELGQYTVVTFKVQNNSAASTTLDAKLSETFGVNLTVGGTDAKYSVKEANTFVGDHFEVTVKYSEGTDATAVLEGSQYTLAAPTASEAGQFIYVVVTIRLRDAVTESTFTPHTLAITFSAETIDK